MLRRSLNLAAVLLLALVWTVSAGAQMKNGEKAPPKTTTKKVTVDINTATEADLAVVLGIEKTAAKKIVEARPFRNKRELVTKQFLTVDQYNKIKDQIVAKRPGGI